MRRPVSTLFAIVASSLFLGPWSCSSGSTPAPSSAAVETTPSLSAPSLTIFLTSEMKGSTEPCGCTSDPLGDLARTAHLIAEARANGPVLFFDGGSTLYTDVKLSDNSRAQEQLKSNLIVSTFRDSLKVDAIGLGPYDFGEGIARVRPPRLATNVSASGLALLPPQVLRAGGVQVGVFAVASPAALAGLGVDVSPMVPAATKAIAQLKSQGAQVIVALAQMTQQEARSLAKKSPGIDFLLVSQNLPEPDKVRPEPTQVGTTWMIRPANRGQVVSRLRLFRPGVSAFTDAIGEVRAHYEIEHLGADIDSLKQDLAKWQSDVSADKGFVAGKRRELRAMVARRTLLKKTPIQDPSKGSYFTLAQLEIRKNLDCQASIVAAKRNYDRESGLANVRAAKGRKPVPATKGAASYVGIEECAMCHKKAVAFWKGTLHARAWKTLKDVGKEYNFDCIGCHVVAFDKPGGSSIAYNETLRDVQCEQCHGPGSIHADAESKKLRISSITLEPDESVCAQCHTPEHSDTFNFNAYLRDITGPGHGAAFRKTLGDGVTGKALRDAAEKAAGTSIGENCPK